MEKHKYGPYTEKKEKRIKICSSASLEVGHIWLRHYVSFLKCVPKTEGHHTSRTRGAYEDNILPGREYQYRGEMKIIKQNQIEINFGVGDRNKKYTTGAQQQI